MSMMTGIEPLRGVMQGTDGDLRPGGGGGGGWAWRAVNGQLRDMLWTALTQATYRSPSEGCSWASQGRSSLVDFPVSSEEVRWLLRVQPAQPVFHGMRGEVICGMLGPI